MNNAALILDKIAANTEVVGIIGLGYVGLPLAVGFAQAGVKVIGFDKSAEKVDKINHGDNYIKDIRDAVLREVVDNITLCATTDFTRIKECDALLICVPTPLDKFRKPDMSYIESACIAIGQNMKPCTFISLESTTYPTTTEDFMLPIILENIKTNPHFKELLAEQSSSSSLPPTGGSRGLRDRGGLLSGSPTPLNGLIRATPLFIPKILQKYWEPLPKKDWKLEKKFTPKPSTICIW